MDPDEHSGDDSRRRQRERFVPQEDWIDAFDAQCTQATFKVLRRYAASWARLLGCEGAGNDRFYAEELVQNALADTMAGVLRWDPDAGDLEPYLLEVIRLRARRDRKRAARYEHVSIDALDLDDSSSSMADLEASLAVNALTMTSEREESFEAETTQTMTRLRALAADNSLAQRFLDAIERDATTRAEIMRTAGLTRAEYHNTRRRLARLVAQLERSRSTSAKED